MTQQQRPKDGFFTRVGILFLYGGLAAFLTAGFYDFWMERMLGVILSQHQPASVKTAMSMATHLPVWFMLAVSAALMVTGAMIFVCEAVDRMMTGAVRLLLRRKQDSAEVQP